MPSAPITSAVPGQFRMSAVSVVLFVSVEPHPMRDLTAPAVVAAAQRQPPTTSPSRCVRPKLLMTHLL